MTTHANRWLLGRKWILIAVGFSVLIALWWAFRPEKLWINQKVNEAAPFDASAGPRPIFTGRFESRTPNQTSGRATIYQKPSGERYLRLSDFTTASAPNVHVLLAKSGDRNLAENPLKGDMESVDLGPLKSNLGDQDYDLPSATDLNKYDAVFIYDERSHSVFGSAKLESF